MNAFARGRRRLLPLLWCGVLALSLLRATPRDFDLPAQPADQALLACSQQAQIEVLFSPDELRHRRSTAVQGRCEPEAALRRLLDGTGFVVQRNERGKFLVIPAQAPVGTLRGRLLTLDGFPARGVLLSLPEARRYATTDRLGDFVFPAVPPGTYRLVASGHGLQTAQWGALVVEANRELQLPPQILRPASEPLRLDPYVVEDKSAWSHPFDRGNTAPPPRTAAGNIDLHRTTDDVLPFAIYHRDQIERSGVVSLNEFLQRELLDSNVTSASPEQDGSGSQPLFLSGSTNLGLRGYDTDETVVLVNGRRMPEIVVAGRPSPPPDVNLVPLSLVQQVQVLPVSASALYSGNAVGGVINIVLRPDVEANLTEVTTTYTNALRDFDAPQSSVSLLHHRTLLGGALRLRCNLVRTAAMPATEAELNYRSRRGPAPWALDEPVYRATPNVRSASGSSLLGRGTAAVASVAPGSDGSGGLAPFAGRAGVRNFDLFRGPAGLAASINAQNNPYGRRQRRDVFYGSVAYDLSPRLQVALDATVARMVVNRGRDVIAADLAVADEAPLNPFGQEVRVSLNETAPLLGENYGEARMDFGSAVLGLLAQLPGGWKASWDTQYAQSLTHFRGLAGADTTRWEQLIARGAYQPFRDTQRFAPPAAFYDEVLVYRGHRGATIVVGDYEALDLAWRATQESFPLPTGKGTLNVGADYRRNHFRSFRDERRYGDGTLAAEPVEYEGRTLQRYSVFGEVQAALLPEKQLPRWLRRVDADLAVRYVAADTAREANLAPTCGLKLDFAGGLALRGSFTTSSRYPNPHLSREMLPLGGPGAGIDYEEVLDPRRHERYGVQADESLNPILQPEEALTQTAGLIYRRGKTHAVRLGLDYVDTRKTNELVLMNTQMVLNLERLFPERIARAAPTPGDPTGIGRVRHVLTGVTNMAWRRSQSWNLSGDYAFSRCLGGTLSAHARMIVFQRYDRQVTPDSGAVDELRHPDGTAPGLLRYRATFGAGWANARWGAGWDGQYFHSRRLPEVEWASQGKRQINPYWQFAAYAQSDLSRWLPGKSSRYGLRGQLRVNNIFNAAFPRYANDPSGAGVQPYGDWRGRVYSLAVTVTF